MDQIRKQTGRGIAYKAVELAEIMEGRPYKFGGKNRQGFDCSGFVSDIFMMLFPEKANSLSMNAQSFANSDLFETVETPKPGDIICFKATGNGPGHVGIVVDEYGWIGSQSSTGVAYVLFNNAYWSKRGPTFRRYLHSSPKAIQAYLNSIAAA
ncbi:MAG TPA: NlpC/P60 family protein [Limnobacter sp.]|uniref:C40 family peptidase n=1 Tax=Limnobacter sp. TaxID=2003368 RepID=UPI002EDA4876